MLGIEKQDQPQAEYWLGAHPAQPSQVVLDGDNMLLPDFIKQNPQRLLGERVAARFGELPFLLKVLDVRQMLSIQVHPSQQSAAVGFEEENKKGVPLTAPNRNYRDRNHKPELMVALGDFWLLHGFKPAEKLAQLLKSEPDLGFLLPAFENGGYEGLYRMVMEMPQNEVNHILQPIIDRITPLYRNGELQKKEEDFWVARAAETFCANGRADRGIFSIYLFNLVHLVKGQGIFQAAGLPHAYLEGQNVEIMANSDNVLRAGLTNKHIDIAELMKHVRFDPTEPAVLAPAGDKTVYKSPAAEFELTAFQGGKGARLYIQASGPEILLVVEGAAVASENGVVHELPKGAALFILAGTEVELQLLRESSIFRASVP